MKHATIVLAFLLGLFSCVAASGDVGMAARVSAPTLYDDADAERFLAAEEIAPAETSAETPQEAPVTAPDDAKPERFVIYSAALRLVVVSVVDASNSTLAIAKEAGGHLQASDASSITIRVPAAKFESVVAQVSKLGELLDRNIQASDVTEEMIDLGIRLDNAQRARERLLEHLQKSEKVEDTLKIEQELMRVTLEIERIEGRLRYLRSQISMSTIRVQFNSRSPRGPAQDGLAIPFEWIGQLGDGLLAGAVESFPRKPWILSNGPSFKPPDEFLRYYSSDELVEAMDADGLRIKVQRHANYDKGAIGFWSKLARRALVESRSLVVASERELDDDRSLIVGSRDVGGERFGYLLLLARSSRRVHSFEAWGPAALFDAKRDALEKSALSLER